MEAETSRRRDPSTLHLFLLESRRFKRLMLCLIKFLGPELQPGCNWTPTILTHIQRSSTILGICCRGEEGTAGAGCPPAPHPFMDCYYYPVTELDRKSQVSTPAGCSLSEASGQDFLVQHRFFSQTLVTSEKHHAASLTLIKMFDRVCRGFSAT